MGIGKLISRSPSSKRLRDEPKEDKATLGDGPLGQLESFPVPSSQVSTPERATQAWPIKGVEDLSENCAA